MSAIETEVIQLIKGQTRPALTFTWKDSSGNVLNFSTGFTGTCKIGEKGATALTTIASVALAATSPNVTVTPTTAEMAPLVVGETYILQLSIASASEPRIKQWKVTILPAVL